MHVLIVDGFGEQPESRARFETFRAMIVKAFEDAWPLPRHYEVRSYRELGDFLYESADGMVRVDTIRRFDKLDFIFLDGDLQLRPWSASSRQALALLLMCATTGKCVYATGWTAALALCAINIKGVVDHVPRLVHSHPEGGSAADLPRLAPPLDDRMFLDARRLPAPAPCPRPRRPPSLAATPADGARAGCVQHRRLLRVRLRAPGMGAAIQRRAAPPQVAPERRAQARALFVPECTRGGGTRAGANAARDARSSGVDDADALPIRGRHSVPPDALPPGVSEVDPLGEGGVA